MSASLTTQAAAPALAAYSLNKPEELSGLAALLAHHIQEKKLYTDIQGKKHVNVEGWQFAGAMLGIVPIVEKVDDVSTGTQYTFKGYQGRADTVVAHIEFRAAVSLLDLRSGKTIGRGIASCSNLESKKRTFDPYAVESMAQTRATGKAFRLLLAWIVQAGGYATTPTDEMPDVGSGAEEIKPVPVTVASQIQYATAAQKEQINELLKHPAITPGEQTRVRIKLNEMDEAKAADTIDILGSWIAERPVVE